jgi:hypothetical protein
LGLQGNAPILQPEEPPNQGTIDSIPRKDACQARRRGSSERFSGEIGGRGACEGDRIRGAVASRR